MRKAVTQPEFKQQTTLVLANFEQCIGTTLTENKDRWKLGGVKFFSMTCSSDIQAKMRAIGLQQKNRNRRDSLCHSDEVTNSFTTSLDDQPVTAGRNRQALHVIRNKRLAMERQVPVESLRVALIDQSASEPDWVGGQLGQEDALVKGQHGKLHKVTARSYLLLGELH